MIPMPDAARPRRWICSIAIAALLGSVVAARGFDFPTAEAACAIMGIPTVEVTGVVIAASETSGAGMRSYSVNLRSDDGANHHVGFSGRDPRQPNLRVEDSYRGILPVVGGRYRIVGSQPVDPSGPIVVNECIPRIEVTRLSTPSLTGPPTAPDWFSSPSRRNRSHRSDDRWRRVHDQTTLGPDQARSGRGQRR